MPMQNPANQHDGRMQFSTLAEIAAKCVNKRSPNIRGRFKYAWKSLTLWRDIADTSEIHREGHLLRKLQGSIRKYSIGLRGCLPGCFPGKMSGAYQEKFQCMHFRNSPNASWCHKMSPDALEASSRHRGTGFWRLPKLIISHREYIAKVKNAQ